MKTLTDEALLSAFIDTLGLTKAVSTMGWAVLSGIGAPSDADRRWYRQHGIGGQATRYRRVADLIRVREALLEAGYNVAPETDRRPVVVALAGASRGRKSLSTENPAVAARRSTA